MSGQIKSITGWIICGGAIGAVLGLAHISIFSAPWVAAVAVNLAGLWLADSGKYDQ